MKLAVVFPSRGLVFSRTVEDVFREVRSVGCEWEIFFSHSQPIPDCFNVPASAALRWGADWVWFVEEDMSLPAGVLGEMFLAPGTVVAADYPVRDGLLAAQRDPHGNVLFAGTGCLLVHSDTLNAFLPFTTAFQYERRGASFTRVPAADGAYGLHDVEFGMRLHEAGSPITLIRTICSQFRVERGASTNTNTLGWHEIRELSPDPVRRT